MHIDGVVMPTDVESQTAQIIQSGIAAYVRPDIRVEGGLNELLFWPVVQTPPTSADEMGIFVQRRDGRSGANSVLSTILPVAYIDIDHPRPINAAGAVLTREWLQFLVSLAMGPEEFDLQPGLRLTRTQQPIPKYEHGEMAMHPGQTFVIERVFLGRVAFKNLYCLPRSQVTSLYFSA